MAKDIPTPAVKPVTVGHGMESLVLMIESRQSSVQLWPDQAEALAMDLIRQAGYVRNAIAEGYADDEH